jgi:glycosyltransferase involved in cell wall biosynthesis
LKILFLTQIVPFPLDSGPKIKTYNVLRYLATRHQVHLVAFVRSKDEETAAASLTHVCAGMTTVPLKRSRGRDIAHLVRSLAMRRSFLVDRDDSRAFRSTLRQVMSETAFDAVHADQFSMGQFAVDLPLPMRVLDEHNAVWTIVQRSAAQERGVPRRLLAEREWRKVRSYEGEMCRRFDRVLVVSEEDRRALREAAGTSFAAEVLPIAVDTEELAFEPRTEAAQDVLSLATMFYPPNSDGVHWFAKEVFPLVRRAAATVQFLVVGSRPPRSVAKLAWPGSNVVVTGHVNDLEPVLRQTAVMVVPLRSGSGMRVKILEAFARGIPVVSTSVGVEGIAARADEHLLVADEPHAFAEKVVRLLQDPEAAARLARAARELVEVRYDWRTVLRGLDAIYGGRS